MIFWQQIICGLTLEACGRWSNWVFSSELFNIFAILFFLLIPFNHFDLTLESMISFHPLEKVRLHHNVQQMECQLIIEVVLYRGPFNLWNILQLVNQTSNPRNKTAHIRNQNSYIVDIHHLLILKALHANFDICNYHYCKQYYHNIV